MEQKLACFKGLDKGESVNIVAMDLELGRVQLTIGKKRSEIKS